MKKIFLLLFGFCLVSLLATLSSCKHELDAPSNPEISFASGVQPIIGINCTYSGCHGSVDFTRIQLLTYNDVLTNGGIEVGNATKSKLYKSITGKGADIMPPSPHSPLSDIDIKTILLWIRQGAKNN